MGAAAYTQTQRMSCQGNQLREGEILAVQEFVSCVEVSFFFLIRISAVWFIASFFLFSHPAIFPIRFVRSVFFRMSLATRLVGWGSR